MKFGTLVEKTSNLPVFTVRFLSAGEDPARIRLQINRWVKSGKVIKVHKGLYSLATPYTKASLEPFYIANALKKASYVSLHSAMSWYGMIPEFVPAVTSVTTGRPQLIETPAGRFEFRHVSKHSFWGYRRVALQSGLHAFIAHPEKALLDYIYLTPRGDLPECIGELRLQNFEQIDVARLRGFAERFRSSKLERALRHIEAVLDKSEGFEL